jgi:hypothetical protein
VDFLRDRITDSSNEALISAYFRSLPLGVTCSTEPDMNVVFPIYNKSVSAGTA